MKSFRIGGGVVSSQTMPKGSHEVGMATIVQDRDSGAESLLDFLSL